MATDAVRLVREGHTQHVLTAARVGAHRRHTVATRALYELLIDDIMGAGVGPEFLSFFGSIGDRLYGMYEYLVVDWVGEMWRLHR